MEETEFIDENGVEYEMIYRLDTERVIAYRKWDPLPALGYIVRRPVAP